MCPGITFWTNARCLIILWNLIRVIFVQILAKKAIGWQMVFTNSGNSPKSHPLIEKGWSFLPPVLANQKPDKNCSSDPGRPRLLLLAGSQLFARCEGNLENEWYFCMKNSLALLWLDNFPQKQIERASCDPALGKRNPRSAGIRGFWKLWPLIFHCLRFYSV